MEENMNDSDVMHEIIPKFNFIYELGMPTGKKIKSTLFLMFIFLIGYIIYLVCGSNISSSSANIAGINVMYILNIVLLIGIIFTVIKLIIHIVFQTVQYRNIKYTFYKNYMIYEDNFLNQHRKNIQYSNIKEVEIRRSVWDRLLGYGIIVIYTNAENEYSNGLVIFSIKNPKEHYDIIDNLVHKSKEKQELKEEPNTKIEENVEENKVEEKVNIQEEEKKQTPEEFRESLNQINRD